MRPADGAAAGVWLSRGPVARVVPCWPRTPPEAGGRAPPHARSRPSPGGPADLTTGRRARGGSGPVCRRPSRPPRPGRPACRAARRRAPDGGCHAGSALCQAAWAAHPGSQRPPTLTLAQSGRLPCPTRALVETEDSPHVARAGDSGGPARRMRAARGPLPHRLTGLPDPPEPPGHHAARCGGRPCRRPRRTLPPALAGRNRARASQDHDADGCAALSNGTGRAAGADRLGHRRQPGLYGHVAISRAPTRWRGADQLPGCAAVARCAEHRNPVSGVARHPHPTASRGAARQETAAQELPLDDHTPARTASAGGTARAQRLTSCHSAKSPVYYAKLAMCYDRQRVRPSTRSSGC
jgi:hypothetical protein